MDVVARTELARLAERVGLEDERERRRGGGGRRSTRGPAKIPYVFPRRNIGVRLVPRLDFIFAAAVLIGLSYVEHPFDRQLATFAVLFVPLVFVHNTRHTRRIKRGFPEWRSHDAGQSWIFGFLPLPAPLVRVIIEPTLCALFGWRLSDRGDSTFHVGWWITIGGGFLFNLENRIRVARRHSLLDLGDTVIESIHYSRRAEKFAEGAGRAGAAAGGASVKPRRSWLHALWKSAPAAGRARRAQREADERQQSQREEARARAREEPAQREQDAEDPREAWSDPTPGRMTPEQALEILEQKPGAPRSRSERPKIASCRGYIWTRGKQIVRRAARHGAGYVLEAAEKAGL